MQTFTEEQKERIYNMVNTGVLNGIKTKDYGNLEQELKVTAQEFLMYESEAHQLEMLSDFCTYIRDKMAKQGKNRMAVATAISTVAPGLGVPKFLRECGVAIFGGMLGKRDPNPIKLRELLGVKTVARPNQAQVPPPQPIQTKLEATSPKADVIPLQKKLSNESISSAPSKQPTTQESMLNKLLKFFAKIIGYFKSFFSKEIKAKAPIARKTSNLSTNSSASTDLDSRSESIVELDEDAEQSKKSAQQNTAETINTQQPNKVKKTNLGKRAVNELKSMLGIKKQAASSTKSNTASAKTENLTAKKTSTPAEKANNEVGKKVLSRVRKLFIPSKNATAKTDTPSKSAKSKKPTQSNKKSKS